MSHSLAGSEPDGEPLRPAGRGWLQTAPPARAALLCLFLLAILLAAFKAQVAVSDPFFGGDAAHRLHHADTLIVRLENRLWLPLLQSHIFVLYLFQAPSHLFKLIPCLYFFIGVLALGILAHRLAGKTYSGLIFSVFLMLCFSYQQLINILSVSLYQEVLGAGLFYVLLCAGALHLKRSGVLFAVGALALLARDTFWIYLFVLSLLRWKAIISDPKLRRAFLLLWAIPALWLLAVPLAYQLAAGRLPEIPYEWPLMINKMAKTSSPDISTTARSLSLALYRSRALFVVLGLILASAAGIYCRMKIPKPSENFAGDSPFGSDFKRFSLLSLGIIYGLIFMFDPWQATFANQRMAAPLVEHLFVWIPVMYAQSGGYSPPLGTLARAVLIAAALLSVNPQVSDWLPRNEAQAQECHAEVRTLVREFGGRAANVCFAGDSYWDMLRRFVAPTLYANRLIELYKPPPDWGRCDMVISEPESGFEPGETFNRHMSCSIEGTTYTIYRKSDR